MAPSWRGALAGIVAAALPMALLWGFTVDDALISARVASQLLAGHGYRFNPGGPPADAVTPLGWAILLVPFAREPLLALYAAKWLGALCWLGAAGWLGARIATLGNRPVRFAPLVVLAGCAPLAAWAVAGMETGVVTALATLALGPSRLAPLFAGLAAAWRPELLPWAVVLTGLGHTEGRLRSLAMGLVPSVVVMMVRQLAFGHPAPLAVFAKPSDFDHGVRYALGSFGSGGFAPGALILTGPPWLVVAPRLLAKLPRSDQVVVMAAAVHVLALVAAGGDWMPLFRLMVPVLPGLLLVGAALAERAPPWATGVRVALALGVSALLWVGHAPDARRVGERRAALVEAAARPLRGAGRVATLDVGWVGAAASAPLLDLAGVTERRVAVLPGGHTSKRIPRSFLDDVDALVLLTADSQPVAEPWQRTRFARAVEQRVAALAGADFSVVAQLPLRGTQQRYLVLKRSR